MSPSHSAGALDGLHVRVPSSDDRDRVLATVQAAELLPPEALPEVGVDLDRFLRGSRDVDQWWVAAIGPDVVGVAYAAAERMTDRTWNLQMLAVHPGCQGRGVGTALVRGAEAELQAISVRLLVIDTSGLTSFTGQRRFYRHLGYAEQGRIADFYEDGDDKVVFIKHLA